MVTQKFILDSKIYLVIQKTRIAIATRLYSSLIEQIIRSHKNYAKLLVMRKDKTVDRKKTAAYLKKLLKEMLAAKKLTVESFAAEFARVKKTYTPYLKMVEAEKETLKQLKPQLRQIPIYCWMQAVKGLGDKYAVKLISKIQFIQRFKTPSKLRTYFGIAPGMKLQKNREANFDPELKGVLLGQMGKTFLLTRSQYRRIYDEKKQRYIQLHQHDLDVTEAKKLQKQKITKEDWTLLKIHNYSVKAMMQRFSDDMWRAWFLSEGVEPPRNPYIANVPGHVLEPMVVPYPPPKKLEKENK